MSESFSAVVDRLSRIAGVRGALVVDAVAAVPIVAELSDDVDGQALAALAASMFGRTVKASATADFGSLSTLQLEADNGHMLVVAAGEVLVVVITSRDAQLGLVRLEANRASGELA